MTELAFEDELYDMTSSVLPELFEYFNASYVFDEFPFNAYRTDLVFVQVDYGAVYERLRRFGHLTPILKKNRQNVYNWVAREGPVTEEEFMEDGPYAESYKLSLLRWLVNRGYVVEVDAEEDAVPNEWMLEAQVKTMYQAVEIPFHSTIYAVELKQEDWEYAIEQANRSYRYADYWYVCLDAGGVPADTEGLREELAEYGVGLLTADSDGVYDVSWTGEPSHRRETGYECLYRGDFDVMGQSERWRLNEESLEAIQEGFVEADASVVHPSVVCSELYE